MKKDDQNTAAPDPEAERAALEKTWRRPDGWIGWFMETDHKVIGIRYVATAFLFFVMAGALAALMRLQLAIPDNTLLTADQYNQVFTTHGVAMMFLFAVPVMDGMGIYLLPLMLGTRSIAFPRLVALSYYVFLFGGLMVFGALLFNTGPDSGWFSYVPLSGPEYGAGKRGDVFNQLINFTEISALAVACSLVTTVFKLRGPGMTLNRIPLFAWSMVVASMMVIFAMPSVVTSSMFQLLDHLVGTHFFNPAEGGDVILYQHLFWFFGHPEVYIIFVPALGFISTIITASTQRRMFGYPALVLSLFTTGFLGFGLWVHHMFATALPQLGMSFFTAASMIITIPTGTQIFCWLAQLWRGGFEIRPPLLWVLGFFVIFIIGGLSGVTLASVPLDLQVTDTYYVVAHLHYVLIGGAVFPLIGAIYFWYPKATGRMLDERLGTWNFWAMFIGFNITFFPMHALGLMGMPRRVYTYPASSGWGTLNFISTLGALMLATGGLLLVFNLLRSLRSGKIAGDNPWNADTLEWSLSSPPPVYNFLELPVVEGRHALWDRSEAPPFVTGMRTDIREVLITDVMDAEPIHKMDVPEPSIWPFITAVTTSGMLFWVTFTPWGALWGSLPVGIAVICWFWPKYNELIFLKDSLTPDAPAPIVPEVKA